MKKHYFFMMLLLLLSFSGRAMAQTTHKITLEYEAAAFKNFFMYNGDDYLCNVGQGSTPVSVPDGANVFLDMISLKPGYELIDVLVNDASATFNSTRTRANFGAITADTHVKIITKAGGEAAESFPVNFKVNGETPQGCFLSVWAMNPGAGMSKVNSGDKLTQGTKIRISWGVSQDYNIEVLVNGEALSQDILSAKNHMVTVDKALNIEATFTSKNPVVTTHNITVVADPFTAGEVTMTSKGAAVGGGTSGNKVNHGDDLVISIKANQGNEIDDVLINNASVKAELTDGENGVKVYTIASVEEDIMVNVNFKRASYPVALNVSPAEGGVVTMKSGETVINSGDAVSHGAALTLTIEPGTIYQLQSVIINDADVTAEVVDGVYTIASVTGPQAINVLFSEVKIDYCKPEGDANKRRSDHLSNRLITNLTFSGLTKNGEPFAFSKQPNKANGWYDTDSQVEVYRDFTADVIEATQGDKVKVTFERYELAWMHYYLYIDYDHDGVFNTENELVSFSYYSDTEADMPGKDGNVNEIPEFTIPADALTGETRIRFKVDWNDKNPCGSTKAGNEIGANGGHIFDFTLNINEGTVAPIENYAMNVTVEGQGTVAMQTAEGTAVENNATVAAGSNVTLTFNAAEGYKLGTVTVNEADVTASVVDGTYTIENVQAEQNIVVTYVEDVPAIVEYDFAISTVGEGTFTLTSEKETIAEAQKEYAGKVAHDTFVTLAVAPAEGWELGSVVKNEQDVTAEIVEGSMSFVVEANVNIVVTYVEKAPAVQHNVTISTVGKGSLMLMTMDGVVNPSFTEYTGAFDEGTALGLVSTPDSGWKLATIMLNDEDVTANIANGGLEFSVEQDINLVVTFVENKVAEYAINWTIEGEGVVDVTVINGGSLANGDKVKERTDLMIYIYPAKGWEVSEILINDADVTADYKPAMNELKVAEIAEDKNIVVKFTEVVGIDSNLAEAAYYDAAAQIFRAPADAQVELFNITGAKVAEAQGNLNMAAMNHGLYLAKVSMAGKTVVVKIMK